MNVIVDDLLVFFERGGFVLWLILLVSIVMWIFVIERYLYYFFTAPKLRNQLQAQWLQTNLRNHMSQQKIKNNLADVFKGALQRYLKPLNVLAEILPLLGLLGTISGMIKVFDVITLFGVGNARGMAAGISEAMITTMAGLVTALSGMYFCVNLASIAKRKTEQFKASLIHHGATKDTLS